jgi:hypothetical protein
MQFGIDAMFGGVGSAFSGMNIGVLLTLVLVPILITLFVFGPILFLLLYFKVYKHKVVIREVVGGRKRVVEKRAKDYIDKDGRIKMWKLWNEKDKQRRFIPVPPSEVLELTHKGKNFVECYRNETGDIQWVKDSVNIQPVPSDLFQDVPEHILKEQDMRLRDELMENWKAKRKKDWMVENFVTHTFEPYTSNQRISQVVNTRKAEERRRKPWTENMAILVNAGVVVILMIVIIMHLVYWGDLTEPGIEKSEVELRQLEVQAEIVQGLSDLQQQVQRIEPGPSEEPPN